MWHYILAASILPSAAIWQAHAWHAAQRRWKDNRCHPKHTIPALWARLGYIKKNKPSASGESKPKTKPHLVSKGLNKALRTQAQMLSGTDGILDAPVSSSTHTGWWYLIFYVTCLLHQKKVSESIIRRDYKATSKQHFSTVWWVEIV